MKTMLKVEHVSINYKIGDFKDIGLKEWTMRHLKNQYHVETFMAVDDVSFELREGDMLGIIGTNGAGKSTLLKAVIGVMEPRKGRIERHGNVSALLELASGFDGDLTVKENAYLRGAMLGYTKDFMDETYEQILDFSELWEFEDRPFKQLSTGMQSRLAFSIASMVQPEILILDEVLSVGDGAFQEKSAAKMREIINGGAATILVSHSLGQIRELCNKVLWLHKGKQIAFGETQKLCDWYEAFLAGHSNESYLPGGDCFKPDIEREPKLSECRIEIEAADITMTGEETSCVVPVTLRNLGRETISSQRKYPIYLAYRILDREGGTAVFDGEWTAIHDEIPPGTQRDMKMRLSIPSGLAPSEDYICRITLVADGFFWFDQDGGNKTDVSLRVP